MFPALAKQTFDRLKKERSFTKIFSRISLSLKALKEPLSRAKSVHKEVDYFIAELLEDPIVKKNIQCKKSCTYCCHTQVSVTSDEVELMKMRLDEGLVIDLDRLKLQSLVSESPSDFYKLDYEDRKCVFLNDSGSCQIYEDRPSVCRSNYSISPPSQCSTEDGLEKKQRLLLTEKADMAIMAAFSTSKKVGTLPRLLYERLVSK